MPVFISLLPQFFLTVITFFTLPYSPTYFFGLFSSLHLRSAELAHSLLSLETQNSEVSIKPTAQKFPVIYCHCENNIFNLTFCFFPNLTLRFYIVNLHLFTNSESTFAVTEVRLFCLENMEPGRRYVVFCTCKHPLFSLLPCCWKSAGHGSNTTLDKEANYYYASNRGQALWECWLWYWEICLCGSYFCNQFWESCFQFGKLGIKTLFFLKRSFDFWVESQASAFHPSPGYY